MIHAGASVKESLHVPERVSLPFGWRWSRIDRACLGIFDCPHSTPPLVTDGPYLARSQDIRTGSFKINEASRVSEDTYRVRTAQAEPTYGDLLFSREGTYFGIAAEVPKNIRVCLGQRMVLIRPDPDQLDHRFLKYWLDSSSVAAHVYGYRDGTVAERLNLPTIRALPVPLAPMPEQRAIGNLLGTLDEKIELNRAMNETLEAVARTIFKSWFVDFDPVRAKVEGRWRRGEPLPGFPADLYDLLPDSFGDSPVGKIPKTWTVRPIGDCVRVFGGSTPRTEELSYWQGGAHRFATPKDLSQIKGPILLTTERRLTDVGLAQVGSGLLPTGTVLLSSRAPIGYAAIADLPVAINQGIAAMVCDADVPNYYAYFWVRENLDTIISYANGSTFLEISKGNFRKIDALRPSPAVLKAFRDLVAPFFDQIRNNLRQELTLAAIRDALLPKLISGEVSPVEPNLASAVEE